MKTMGPPQGRLKYKVSAALVQTTAVFHTDRDDPVYLVRDKRQDLESGHKMKSKDLHW